LAVHRDPLDSAGFANDYVVAILVAILVEVIRFAFYRAFYDSYWWTLIGSSLIVNAAANWFSLPDTLPWIVLNAAYNQTTLPFAVAYASKLAYRIGMDLIVFGRDIVPPLAH
jgi:hypothetical protein